MDDDEKDKPPMNQPVIRVRERVRQPPVQPVSPAVRVRERVRPGSVEAPSPPAVKIRQRERPLPKVPNPDAYEWGPGMKEIIRELNVWRAGTKNEEVPPPLPDVWPAGSAIMRGPGHPGYRRHPHTWGEEPEKNPNLMGRSVNGRELGRPGGVYLWRWVAMKYSYVGRFENHGEVHTALRK